MATARALASGTVDSAAVADAISEVNQIAGVNIMTTEVVDITDATALAGASADAKELALFNAGLADILVKEAVSGNTVEENLVVNLEDLASSFEDGGLDSSDEVTITQITNAVSTAATTVAANPEIADELEDAVNDIKQTVAVIESQVDENGTFDPEPSVTAGSDEITQAKALITETRTFIEKIASDVKESGLQEPLDAFSIDPDTISAVLSNDSAVMAALLGEVIEQTVTDLGTQIETRELVLDDFLNNASTPFITTITDSENNELGSITSTFASTDAGISITLKGSITGNGDAVDDDGNSLEPQTVNIDLVLATNLNADDLTTAVDSESGNVLLTAITADTASLTLTGKIGNTATQETSLTLNEVALALSASETVSIDMKEDADNSTLESKISGASFSGDLTIAANGSTFDGDVDIALVGYTDSAVEVPLSLQSIAVNGIFTDDEGDSFSTGAKLEISNASSFDTFGYLNYQPTAYEYVDFSYNMDPTTSTDIMNIDSALSGSEYQQDAGTVFELYYGSYNDLYRVGNAYSRSGSDIISSWLGVDLDIDLPVLEAAVVAEATSGYTDTPESSKIEWLDYFPYQTEYDSDTGTFNYVQAGYVHGGVQLIFADFETADNFVQGTFTVTADLNVSELPQASVVASASRTAFAGGNAQVTVSYDGSSFTIAAESDDLEAEEYPTATLSITNPDGVKLSVNMSETQNGDDYELAGTVSVGGTAVGTIEETDNGLVLVRYTDGTFETLY